MTQAASSIQPSQEKHAVVCDVTKAVLEEWCTQFPDSALLTSLQELVSTASTWTTLPSGRLVEIAYGVIIAGIHAHPDATSNALSEALKTIGPEGYASGDQMNYLIRIPSALSPFWTADLLEKSLADRNIQGISWPVLEDMIQQKTFDRWVCVASGTQPVPGNDACFTDVVGVYGPAGDLEPSGDYSDRPLLALRVQAVHPDTVLVEKKSPTEGQAGENIYGETVIGPKGIDYDFLPWEGARLSPEGDRLIAGMEGFALVESGHLVVTDGRVLDSGSISGDRPVQFSHSIRIQDELNTETPIESSGYVILEKEVRQASIQAGKSILSRGAIQAQPSVELSAKTNIVVQSLLNVHAVAQGSVYCNGPLVDSNVEARRVWCGGEDAAIRGGRIQAWDDVHADVLGAAEGIKTEIIIAEEQKTLKSRQRDLRIRMDDRKTQINKLSAALSKLPEELIQLHEKAQKLRMSVLNLKKEVKQIARSLRTITLQLQAGRDAPRTVRARAKIYPGVTVRIFGKPFVVDETLGPTCITWADGDIVCLPYQERSWSDGLGGSTLW